VKLEFEATHCAEVAAAAADRPEQVGFVVSADFVNLAVGRHDFGAEHVVDRQPVLAVQPSETAAERKAADAGVRNDAGRGHEPLRQRCVVEVAE
jgi:hypothetical protein